MIRFEDIWLSFGDQTVLHGVNMTAQDGSITAIVGQSGSGKSTLLRLIIGFLQAARGQLIIDGQDVAGLSGREWVKLRQKMGMVFQNSALFDSLTVCRNVAFYPHYVEKKPWKVVRPQVMELLAEVGLADHSEKLPNELSGGMRRRAALARSLIYRPKILLYDEPTTGLDPQMIQVVNELILEMNEKYKVTSVVVTHDLECIHKIADHVVLLVDGQTTTVGPPQQLLLSADPRVVEFTGSWRSSLAEYAKELALCGKQCPGDGSQGR